MTVFAERLKELRKKKKLTQKELASRIEETQGKIAKWENSQLEPNAEKLKKLAWELETTTDYLLGVTNKTYPTVILDDEKKKIFFEPFRKSLENQKIEKIDEEQSDEELEGSIQSLEKLLTNMENVNIRAIQMESYLVFETDDGNSFVFKK
ncbi:helix-turn-helix domain-containing protein [Lactococcus garvieae]|uniref:helix-turn-helix domain-containing protein n=1 Tax=Lactococcus garvieae TaxID=1363 RepID=UPI003D774C88